MEQAVVRRDVDDGLARLPEGLKAGVRRLFEGRRRRADDRGRRVVDVAERPPVPRHERKVAGVAGERRLSEGVVEDHLRAARDGQPRAHRSVRRRGVVRTRARDPERPGRDVWDHVRRRARVGGGAVLPQAVAHRRRDVRPDRRHRIHRRASRDDVRLQGDEPPRRPRVRVEVRAEVVPHRRVDVRGALDVLARRLRALLALAEHVAGPGKPRRRLERRQVDRADRRRAGRTRKHVRRGR